MAQPTARDVFDCSGVAVITGAASGFGLEAARRCAAAGMRLALLDVDEAGLARAKRQLEGSGGSASQCLAFRCDVGKYGDCAAAATAVSEAFPGVRIALLFNNAGIAGPSEYEYQGHVLDGTPSDSGWRAVFHVNVFGAVNVLKTFVPGMVAAGPFPSGIKSQIVTTSSVMGLYDGGFGLSPYNASKMACTAICEQMHFELKAAGQKAAHVASHSLHPSMAGTNIFRDPEVTEAITSGRGGLSGGLSAGDVMDATLSGIAKRTFYIVVDDPKDVPAREQVRQRMESQMAGTEPCPHRPMAGLAVYMQVQTQKQQERSKL
mmetsp:Transcript_58333/g.156076  ORF Transcript_58333/g.156076 Transcript_58333/m.156076 type:complete len:319 (-) Transcript_58333:81-1037(-)